MIIKPVDSLMLKYRSNWAVISNGDMVHTWVVTTTHAITHGKMMPYGLTLDWRVVYKEKNTSKRIVVCDSRFYMEFAVETEPKDRRDLAVYLESVFAQAQNFIKINAPEYYDHLAPMNLGYEGMAHHFIWDIIQFGCYKEP